MRTNLTGQDMEEETAEKLLGGEHHLPNCVLRRVVLPSEGDLISFQADEAGIGDHSAGPVGRPLRGLV
jgi:hypothetical protein